MIIEVGTLSFEELIQSQQGQDVVAKTRQYNVCFNKYTAPMYEVAKLKRRSKEIKGAASLLYRQALVAFAQCDKGDCAAQQAWNLLEASRSAYPSMLQQGHNKAQPKTDCANQQAWNLLEASRSEAYCGKATHKAQPVTSPSQS